MREKNLMPGALCLFLLSLSHSACALRLNSYFSSGMVLQRDISASIWGYGQITTEEALLSCDSGDFLSSLEQIEADVWKVNLPPQNAGTRCSIQIGDGPDALLLENVVYGDIWLCSGQSNMEQAMNYIDNFEEELANSAAYEDRIRFTTLDNRVALEPDDNLDPPIVIPWSSSDNTELLRYFSAVCFLFARRVHEETGVPMGLIASDWGGTPVEAWSSQEALDRCGVPPAPEWQCSDGAQQNCNSYLWNAMINPLKRVQLKGFLWYQGETNGGYNRDLYTCTFPTMIDTWREEFTLHANVPPLAPFGFVQLSTWRPGVLDAGFPVIRWHQTVDVGYVPNERMQAVFMSSPQDTYDPDEGYPGNIHPRYKQIAAERLAIAGLNVAYGLQDFPTRGPFPSDFMLASDPGVPGSFVYITYDASLEYRDAEISGFYFCAMPAEQCDAGGLLDTWVEVAKDKVMVVDERTILVDISQFGSVAGTTLGYLWRETPVLTLQGLPIYAADKYGLPSPPWKYQLAE